MPVLAGVIIAGVLATWRPSTKSTGPAATTQGGMPPSAPVKVAEKSIAVLAFANLSDDKANEYLSDGISEGLINVLGRVPGLSVRGRTSAFYFKGKSVATEEIAQRLNVAYLVRGSVQKLGSRVRITAELTRAATDEVMWTSEPLDRDVKDIFAVQDEMAGLIAKNLKLTLGHGAAPARQVDPEAHRLYLEGRHFWSQRTEEGFDRAERAFTQAVQRDPTFARAHAGLADLWAIRAWYQGEDGVGAVAAQLGQAEEAAKRALELDPGLVEVHATFGAIRLVAGRIDEANAEFERAVALAPNYATARNWRGELLLLKGRIDGALNDFTAAAQLDPLSPIMVNDCVRILLAVGRPAEALAYAERVAAFGESATGIIYRAHALQELGRCDEAVAAIRALAPRLETTDGFRRRSSRAVYVLRACGREAEAVALASNLMRTVPAGSFVNGFILGALGRFDEAIPLLANMPLMTTRIVFLEQAFDPVRDDPRFQQVMVKLGCAAESQVARETFRRLRSEKGAAK
jgi:TolB-like protein/Tfp pilus assembly protein PilF